MFSGITGDIPMFSGVIVGLSAGVGLDIFGGEKRADSLTLGALGRLVRWCGDTDS